MGEPGQVGRLNTGCFSGGMITSSASEGVNDGSASKIGDVSGEAIWSKSTTKVSAETRSTTDAVQRLASGRSVESSIPGVVKDFVRRDERASAESDPEYRPLLATKMHARRLAQKHVSVAYRVASRSQHLRRLATAPPPETPPPTPSSKPYQHEKTEPERSWVVQKIRANPVAFRIVRALSRAMGYGSTRQVAGRRTLAMYEQVCAVKASEDRVFWQGEHPIGPSLVIPETHAGISQLAIYLQPSNLGLP